ncbi:DUF4253 domain-containing protein [Micropruina sp.]|uniref:DUF4253 domain-containing protein n=1 Tax=Micropruina sp. TaxID=2737536 RepID=UPI0039E5681A
MLLGFLVAEHYAFCPDNVDQDPAELAAYGEEIAGSPFWTFWWDWPAPVTHSSAVRTATARDGMNQWKKNQRASQAGHPVSWTPYSSVAPRPTPRLAP